MELASWKVALSAVVERHAAGTVLPYLRAFDLWQQNINIRDLEDSSLLACKENVVRLAGNDGAVLRVCVEEIEQLGWPHSKSSERHQQLYDEWLKVVQNLLIAHMSLVLTCPREHPRRAHSCMTRGVKYRLYALRNATELRSMRSYWLAATCSGDTEMVVDEAQWNAVEGLPRCTTVDGNIDLRPDLSAIGVVHQQAEQPYGMSRRWSLFVPGQSADVPLVLALHGARTVCDQHLLTWLPTARAHGFAVLSLQSLKRSWGLRESEAVFADIVSVLTTLESVLASYPALDRRRIFLTGMSDGGTFSYMCTDVLSRSGCTFAAGVAITAAFPVPSRMEKEQIVESFRGTPMHHVHGKKDWMFPIEEARAADAAAREAIGEAGWHFTEVPDWTHAVPSAVHEAIVWPWLAKLPRHSSFSGDVKEVVRKFELFCATSAESSDSD